MMISLKPWNLSNCFCPFLIASFPRECRLDPTQQPLSLSWTMTVSYICDRICEKGPLRDNVNIWVRDKIARNQPIHAIADYCIIGTYCVSPIFWPSLKPIWLFCVSNVTANEAAMPIRRPSFYSPVFHSIQVVIQKLAYCSQINL